MKILFLCNKSPYPAREGGPIAMDMMIEGLIRAGHQVKVLALNSNKYRIDPGSIPASYKEKTGIGLVDIDLAIKPKDAFFNLFTSESYHVKRFISGEFRKKLTEILEKDTYDVVQFEMLYMSPYLADVRKHSEAVAVLRAHNIEHKIWERVRQNEKNPLKKRFLDHLVKTLKCYELAVIPKYDGIVAITSNDAAFFAGESRLPAAEKIPVTAIPFGVDPSRYTCLPGKAAFPTLFSLGSMDWIPNEEGIRWFLEKVWPELNRRYPKLTFHIAGRHMPQWLVKSTYKNVVIEGEVEDANAFMNSKAIMVVPLFSGSGIRIKIIEGMAAGKAIVSTTVGAEGIGYTDGTDILIADDPEGFIRQISYCIENKEAYLNLGKAARTLIETSYNRNDLIEQLVAFYQKIRK